MPLAQFEMLKEHMVRRMGSLEAAEKRLKDWDLAPYETAKPKTKTLRKKGLAYEKLGFETYEKYLASDLWWNIRERVLTRDNRGCVLCGSGTDTVHHQSYDLETMRGRDISQLFCVCRSCHHVVEFDGAVKRTHQAAKDVFLQMLLSRPV